MKLVHGAAVAALALSFFATPFAHAQQRAHVHGQVKLSVAVDGPTVVIDMEMPLDTLVGFERAPRTDAEKKTAEAAIARLRAADQLFVIDPAANCKLGPVALNSAALGVGAAANGPTDGHADLDATFAFNCTQATAARFIDVALFTAFKGTRQIEAQLATPQGQFRRTLKRPAGTGAARLSWGP